ncbi:lipocalin-like domain-containing protein [Streptomyces sp. NPDC046759]|uniref:lipocalin-like domain-containing protein n=1 Tax=Streptomyces sp. NPDC046759 TaxID=3155019 RepID=UPI0033F361B4
MTTPRPTLIDAAGGLPATSVGEADSWWFGARLHHEEKVFWVKIHAMEMNGACTSTVALLQEPDGRTSDKHTVEGVDGVTLSADALDVRTSLLTVQGDLDELEISGATDAASIRLTLRRDDDPVLHSGGAGVFPFFGGRTGQYALSGLTTSGTITVDGVTHEVGGRTWFDRQWVSGATEAPRFTWLGLDVGAGRRLSVWDTAGDGSAWLTELRADGAHLITDARRTDRNGQWALTVPALDASLDITHRALFSAPGVYTGACQVTGTLAGEEITGHGFTDVIGY